MKKITLQQEKTLIKLYLKGLSANESALKLGLSTSQAYDTLIRNKIKRRTTAEQNNIRFLRSPTSFKLPSKFSTYQEKLTAAALMLYRGEGAKTGTTVDLANCDPGTLKVFLLFLRKVCKINENRLRLYLYCFSGQNPKKIMAFWTKTLKVKKSSFTKPYIRQKSLVSKRTMPYGVLHVRYSDKRLLEIILSMAEKIVVQLSK